MSVNATVTVDLSALCENAQAIKRTVGDFFCVLKCDAYGHGITECADALFNVGYRRFAVYSLEEALKVKSVCQGAEVLILGRTSAKNAEVIIKNGFIQSVFSEEYAEELSPVSKGMRVHIKLDSGMNRSGFKCGAESIKKAFSRFTGAIEGIYTHFHSADADGISLTKRELEGFLVLSTETEDALGYRLFKHAAASACALRLKSSRLDACRIGLALYGIAPENCKGLCKLTPVMSFSAPITAVKTVRKGENLGYGCDHSAKNDMLVATVSAGYGNGLPRILEKHFTPTVQGIRVPFAARICMDRCMLDVTSAAAFGRAVRVGDTVSFFGTDRSVCEVSEAEGTVPYETLTRVGMMNTREYLALGGKRGRKT